MEKGKWVVVLDNGLVLEEHHGEFTVKPGERLPWVRLCAFVEQADLRVKELRFELGNRTFYMPMELSEFRGGVDVLKPHSYSILYSVTVDFDLGGGAQIERHFVDLAAHYDSMSVHLIQSLDGTQTFVEVSKLDKPGESWYTVRT